MRQPVEVDVGRLLKTFVDDVRLHDKERSFATLADIWDSGSYAFMLWSSTKPKSGVRSIRERAAPGLTHSIFRVLVSTLDATAPKDEAEAREIAQSDLAISAALGTADIVEPSAAGETASAEASAPAQVATPSGVDGSNCSTPPVEGSAMDPGYDPATRKKDDAAQPAHTSTSDPARDTERPCEQPESADQGVTAGTAASAILQLRTVNHPFLQPHRWPLFEKQASRSQVAAPKPVQKPSTKRRQASRVDWIVGTIYLLYLVFHTQQSFPAVRVYVGPAHVQRFRQALTVLQLAQVHDAIAMLSSLVIDQAFVWGLADLHGDAAAEAHTTIKSARNRRRRDRPEMTHFSEMLAREGVIHLRQLVPAEAGTLKLPHASYMKSLACVFGDRAGVGVWDAEEAAALKKFGRVAPTQEACASHAHGIVAGDLPRHVQKLYADGIGAVRHALESGTTRKRKREEDAMDDLQMQLDMELAADDDLPDTAAAVSAPHGGLREAEARKLAVMRHCKSVWSRWHDFGSRLPGSPDDDAPRCPYIDQSAVDPAIM